jgi:serine O-acetyltransferase
MKYFFNCVTADLKRHLNPSKKISIILVLLFGHSFHLAFFFRLGVLLGCIPVLGSFFRLMIEYFIRIFFSSDISCRATIGPGVNLMHGHGIVIGSKVVIGSNCKIFDNTSFGNKYTESADLEQPVIGDNCVIGTGAKILGGISIGNNCIIGANSVVIKDLPSNSVAAGVPAQIIKVK